METSRLIGALAALAQDTRLAIYRLLVEHAPEGLSAGIVARKLGAAPASLSFHFKELVRSGLIVTRRDGRFVYYRADIRVMNELVGDLTKSCCAASAVCDPDCVPAPARAAPVASPVARRRRAA